jgi:hypothetical protein
MPTLSLDAIQEHIAQKDSELRTLRREFEARQNRLQALSKRKLELHDQLGRIESKIAAATVGAKRPTTGLRPVTKTAAKKPTSEALPLTLAGLIVEILQDARRALTVQQMTDAVRKRRFPTKSKVLHKLVGKNAYMMATKGTLDRTKTYPAAFRVSKETGKSVLASATKRAGTARPTTKHKPPIRVAAKSASGPNAQTPLKQLLERFLQKSAKPRTGGELAKEALQAGYRTTSKHFVDSVWTALANMKNVENIKGEGYRLKKSKQ